ncbi:MAG: DMT family transporter [Porticoccaceae bacterium]|nr:DMT family transporter [Porticoccaceae bacterium]MDG1474102.1 DMT family transporter [Porticoccaceae bacterium]
MIFKTELRADLILLVTALIWGFAFVFQSTGMEHIGPITFVFGRFVVATLAIIPIWYFIEKPKHIFVWQPTDKKALQLGVIMVIGMLLQQAGLLYTTVSRAGFLTGVYIVFVPILGVFMGSKTQWPTWLGVSFALLGLYFLAQIEVTDFLLGDSLILLSSVLWALHVIYTGKVANQMSVFRLMFVQFTFSTLISGVAMIMFEVWDWQAVKEAAGALLFVGVLSSCVGFSLQVVGMRTAPASHAALILSFEAIFAAIGGWWLLGEHLTPTELIGCGLILTGGLLSQLKLFIRSQPGARLHP